ncbi:nuclear transport factor 2 family protein [Deinococcus hopiensis]|uniref:Ketosteroid isomerase-related protein n=1 Tax=Deinococcus hopiensis KR-140 TaxID=695939 RepID=A0A1W1VFC3_9DEIO|nr:nuclear transport factor 2 family protein [Deinococcus hopiensis]SMB91910.1 Ketosteroid isomerase-related protein [Deinococcus hopiensis KR-140]
MYHFIVRRIIRGAFGGLNAGKATGVTRLFAPDARHLFIGEHALGGERSTPASIGRWYARLLAVFPGIRFELERVLVSGWPWNTLVVAEWRESSPGIDGVPNENTGVNIIELRWGQVRRVSIYTDTATLERNLKRLARAGVTEAAAPPIVDLSRMGS